MDSKKFGRYILWGLHIITLAPVSVILGGFLSAIPAFLLDEVKYFGYAFLFIFPTVFIVLVLYEYRIIVNQEKISKKNGRIYWFIFMAFLMLIVSIGAFFHRSMQRETKLKLQKVALSSETRLYFQLEKQDLPEIKEDKNYLSVTFKDFPLEKFAEVEERIAELGDYRRVKRLPFNQNDKLELSDKHKIYNWNRSGYHFTIMYNNELKQADVFLKIKK